MYFIPLHDQHVVSMFGRSNLAPVPPPRGKARGLLIAFCLLQSAALTAGEKASCGLGAEIFLRGGLRREDLW